MEESRLYLSWFQGTTMVDITPTILQRAEELAIRYGTAAMDAAHIAVAESVNATLITLESRSKPPHRVPWVRHLDDL